MWSIIGHLLVSYRNPFGLWLSFIWFMFIFWGQFLTWFWFHFGPILVTNWAIIGPKLVNLWAYDYMMKIVSFSPSSWCGMFCLTVSVLVLYIFAVGSLLNEFCKKLYFVLQEFIFGKVLPKQCLSVVLTTAWLYSVFYLERLYRRGRSRFGSVFVSR